MMNRTTRASHKIAIVILALGWIATEMPTYAFRMIQQTSTGRQTAGDPVACNHSRGFVRWHNQTISWRLNTSGQGAGQAPALQAAMQSWTNVSGAVHTLNYAGTTTQGFTTDNVNTLVWANGNGCTGTCLALTALVLYTGQRILESDITFERQSS